MRRCGTLIRFVCWILLTCRKVLESTASNLWKCASRLSARNRAVEVHREVEVCGECATKRARCGDCAALVTGGTKRHDWDHIDRANTWMDAAAGTALCR
jgi:hypothetical protein